MTFLSDFESCLSSYENSLRSLAAQEPAVWIQAHLKIQTKAGALVPFRLNSTQRYLYQRVREAWCKRKAPRFYIPKGRQQGVSTLIQALMFERCYRYSHRNAAVVAHVDEAAENIFGMTTRFYDNLPEKMRDERPKRYYGKEELVFKPPHESRYIVSTVKSGDALGKSYMLQYLHLSEAASYSDRGNDSTSAINSLLQAVPKTIWDTMVFFESTGKGKDPLFYRRIQKVRRPSYKGAWEIVFLPWWFHEEYTVTASGAFARTEQENHLGTELKERQGFVITNDQLEWRRRCIEDDLGGADAEKEFRRYYPSFLDDCFEETDDRFFSKGVVSYYHSHAKKPIRVGDMGGIPGAEAPRFDDNDYGIIRLWDEPRSGERYAIFCDVAEGGPLGDFDSAYVLWVQKIRIVAALHGNRDTDELARILVLLAIWYNKARLAVENNIRGDVSRRIWDEYRYRNTHWDHDISTPRKRLVRPGWNTNRRTRPMMLDSIKSVTRKTILDCPDEHFATEMSNFVWSVRDSKFGACHGEHDDRVIAAAGVVCMSRADIQRIEAGTVESKRKKGALERKRERDEKEKRREMMRAEFYGGADRSGEYIG